MSWFSAPKKAVVGAAEQHEAARGHLDAELEYLRVVLNVAARRLERAGLLPGRGGGGDPFTRAPAPDPLEVDAIEDAARHRDALTARLVRDGFEPPLSRLVRRLGLDEDDRRFLVVALASELAADFRGLFALFDPRGRDVPTVATALSALVPPARWVAVRQRLDPLAPLGRYRLVENEAGEIPGLHDPLRPSLRLLRFASGEVGLDPALAQRAQLIASTATRLPRIATRDDPAPRLVACLALPPPAQPPLLVVRGPVGVGRARLVEDVAHRRGQATLVVDLTDLAGSPPEAVTRVLAEAIREARLQDALLVLRGYAELVAPEMRGEDDPRPHTSNSGRVLSLALSDVLADHPHAVALTVPSGFDAAPELRRPVLVVDVALPDPVATEALWSQYLPSALTAGLRSDALAAAFRSSPGEVEAVSREAVRRATIEHCPIDLDMVRDLVKGARRHRLRDIATLVERAYTWDDLIARPEVKAQLDELVARHRNRRVVMEGWGLARRFGEAVGISALFEGPPGTGKTMAASVVARELGLDLFQVDLSKVMSKWVGETEKHLATLFDEAERAHALILFDEADSLFAKRTEVKDSHDRSANLKVNYLLQRIEHFSGIAVLTTNLPENFDEALARRVSVRVHFPKPDEALRRTLWASMLDTLPGARSEADLEQLAHTFELSGGLIRNAVLRAAYMAAARGVDVDYALLEIAARIELRHQHMLMRGDPMKDLVERYPMRRGS
ncbi:MAG: ATP-binding protein [Deltaproteobacteria bacterium]|nr:ATP-binding protein [Deltaproteobacteria bacterium]